MYKRNATQVQQRGLIKQAKQCAIGILAAVALAVVPATALAQQFPSDLVQGVDITAPAGLSTVGSKFTISGTYRADLGCGVGRMSVAQSGLRGYTYNGIVDPAGLTFNEAQGTFTYFVDATKPLVVDGFGVGDRITPGRNIFTITPTQSNCGSDAVELNVVPVGGVATGAGGSQ